MTPDEANQSNAATPDSSRRRPPRRGRRGGRGRGRGPAAGPLPVGRAHAPETAEALREEAVAAPVAEEISPEPPARGDYREPMPEAFPEPDAPESETSELQSSGHEPEPSTSRHGSRADQRPAIRKAIEQVNQLVEELRRALRDMEDVQETLEIAEIQKNADEHEIQKLQRALRQLQSRDEGRPRR